MEFLWLRHEDHIRNKLELELCRKAEQLVNDKSDIYTILDLFQALSIYKLIPGIAGRTFDPDQVQINLFKERHYHGIRIYLYGKPESARIIVENKLVQ